MTIREAHQYLFQQLLPLYPAGEATTITRWTLEFKLGWNQNAVIRQPNQPLTLEQAKQLEAAATHLKAGMPIQYLIERSWFLNMELFVSPAVLIPRPETEELAQRIITEIQQQPNQPLRMVDVGTGSGCLALAIARNCPQAEVIGLDKSEDAIAVAQENSNRYPCKQLSWRVQDFLDTSLWPTLGMLDRIVSNPPYIPQQERHQLADRVVRYEPEMALFVPNDSPLLFYDCLLAFSQKQLKPSGSIWVEVHEDLARETAYLFEQGFTSVNIHRDMFGKQRMVVAQGKH